MVNRIRSMGAVTVLETGPETPPAIKCNNHIGSSFLGGLASNFKLGGNDEHLEYISFIYSGLT